VAAYTGQRGVLSAYCADGSGGGGVCVCVGGGRPPQGRLVHQPPNEQSFHIFYAMLRGLDVATSSTAERACRTW
jgi:hypothetical protein